VDPWGTVLAVIGVCLLGLVGSVAPLPGVGVAAAATVAGGGPVLVAAAVVGDVLGQTLLFVIGRRASGRLRPVLDRRLGRSTPGLPDGTVPVDRTGAPATRTVVGTALAMSVGRFVAIGRMGMATGCGVARTAPATFLATTIVGAVIEAAVIVGVRRTGLLGVLHAVDWVLLVGVVLAFGGRSGAWPQILRILRRTPATVSVFGVVTAAAIGTGSLWRPLGETAWWSATRFAPDQLDDGRWWSSIVSLVLVPSPLAVGLVLLFGVLAMLRIELRSGSGRALGVFLGGELLAAAVVLEVIAVFGGTGWAWPHVIAEQAIVGPPAGVAALVTAAAGSLRDPWRFRVRLVIVTVSLAAVVLLGTADDLARVVVVSVVIAMQGRARFRRISVRQWRILAATGMATTAAVPLVAATTDTHGPFGTATATTTGWGDVLLSVVVALLLAWPLLLGRRTAWWIVVVLGFLHLLVVPLVVGMYVAGIRDDTAGIDLAAACLWVMVLVVLLAGRRAFRVRNRRRLRAVSEIGSNARAEALRTLRRLGGGTLSWMTTWPGIEYFRTDRGYIGLQRHGDVAVGLGDPVTADEDLAAMLAEFDERTSLMAVTPCLFSVSERVRAAVPVGWRSILVAEDTLVDLPGLELVGKRWQPARGALNRAEREGVTMRMTRLAAEPREVVEQVRVISESWVDDKALPEMGFTLGTVAEALDPEVRVALAVDAGGTVHGISWLPVFGPGSVVRGWTLDLMRRRDDGFGPVIEFLITASALHCKDEGAEFLSLSGAPLTGDADEPGPVQRLVDALGGLLEPVYGFRSLHRFKLKFNPRAEPMYLVYRDEADLPAIATALARSFLPGATTGQLLRAGLSAIRN
jgi:hypothetical protein